MDCAEYKMIREVGIHPLHVKDDTNGVIYSTDAYSSWKDVSLYMYNASCIFLNP